MSRPIKLALLTLWSASLLAIAQPAAASKTFPEPLRKQLKLAELPYPPLGCQLCHTDDKGGYQTATKPFGRSMFKARTVGGNLPSMLTALDTLESAGTDSDHDGSGDIDELKAGTDPNVAMTVDGMPPPVFEEIPLPETGCALAGVGPSRSSWLVVALAALASARVLRRRRPR